MGRTYVVRHITTGNLACLKACLGIGPEYEEVFLNEAKAIWDIRHYAFPAVRDLLRLEDGALAIVMSYIPGPTLEQVVKHLGPIDPEHCGWIFERLLAGLNYLHASGVIHGDIKPQNIILQPERHGAVLIDFGLSMMKPTSKSANIGYTEHFSPPEQASTSVRKPLIPETDLYSLAMTILYALTGKLTDKHSIPSTVPREFKNFLLKFLETEVLKRPNWEKENILEGITKVRIACFGTKNTRGKIFPNVPCDVVV
jgi:serine/threonine protein kinase